MKKTKNPIKGLALTAYRFVFLILLAFFLASCGKEVAPEAGGGIKPTEGDSLPRVMNFWQPG